jgi:hypothetical protein
MSLLANVLGFSAFGFATRCFQLGLQKRFMFAGTFCAFRHILSVLSVGCLLLGMGWLTVFAVAAPQTHVLTAAGFGAVGWGVYELEQRQ